MIVYESQRSTGLYLHPPEFDYSCDTDGLIRGCGRAIGVNDWKMRQLAKRVYEIAIEVCSRSECGECAM